MLRKATEHRIEQKAHPGQAHRSAAGAIIDYRLQEITNSAARAISTVEGNFIDKPQFKSPWHFHDCDMQIAVVMDGSVELGYRADAYARAEKGDVLFIPGQTMHDVGAPSHDYQIAEITFPGTFGTTEAPMPDAGKPTPAMTLGCRDAPRVGVENGLAEYRFPVPAPYDKTYDIRRFVRTRTSDFSPTTRVHHDRYRMLVGYAGWADVDFGDGTKRLERGDMLVLPADRKAVFSAVSDDFTAYEVRLLDG